MKSNINIIATHKDDIRVGDTVMVKGVLITVGLKDISYGGFMGSSLFGDSSRVPVDKVLFRVPTNNGIIYR
jgi:hypothetical protein